MKIILKNNEEKRILSGHQWIFSNEIERTEDYSENGQIAELFTSFGKFIGKGFYNKNSLIAYRHLTEKYDEKIDGNFIFKRLSAANSLRRKKLNAGEVYRLANSESDFLPGLIIDKFENKYSIQIFSAGMELLKMEITEVLKNNFKADFIIEKNDNEIRTLEGLERKEEVLFDKTGTSQKEFLTELDGIKIYIDLVNGQKTGYYLDQQENRILLRKYIKPGDNVLDLFCNEGGFALNAAFAGAEKVTATDSSEHSIKMCKRNSGINGFTNTDFIKADVFEFLNDGFQKTERFDFIILDPPSFTKSRKNVYAAIKGYTELNYKAMKLLKPNSFLFTFSCSHHISEKAFEEMLIQSAEKAGRSIQIIEFRNSSFDHPVLPQMSETKYLKGYLLRVNV
ncbi:MAG TPA: class I SAM-dependent rRNA methyltransferase [Ignavibacteria bacterium]|nr:class I SAM-dependent rRNA methyltransferase [Ignavibacteria bacterium]HRJ98062.1 class I SAM-dependent rRNA methyltransferase [Ignavibacteria bacterium]